MTVYLLLGDDDERKSRSIGKLRGDREVSSFDAGESGPEPVISACDSYSLFGEGPFVVVRNLDSWNADQKSKLTKYLENPSPEAVLVLLARKLNSREKLLSAVKRVGEIHELDQPTGKELVRWLKGYTKECGASIPDELAGEVISRCKNDKLRLMRETEKMALHAEGGEISLDDVEALCPPDIESNIFAFVDSLASGRREEALGALEGLFSFGEPPLRVLYMIRRQFQLILRAKSLSERGVPRKEIPGKLKVPPFVARKLEDQGRGLSEEDVEKALAMVLDLERGLKGGSDLSPEFQVELVVLELCGPV